MPRAQRPRQVERARKLVRLHARQHDHAGAGSFDHCCQAFGADSGIGFVKGLYIDIDIFAQDAALGAILGQPVE
jgi:hypothetical protein